MSPFSSISAKYPHLGECKLSENIDEMIDYLLKALALTAQEGADGLSLGADITDFLLLFGLCTPNTEKGLPALNYLRQHYDTEGAPQGLREKLGHYMVEYLPFLAEMQDMSRADLEAFVKDAAMIIEGTDVPPEWLACYQLLVLRALGLEEEWAARASEWRARQWNLEISGCESCVQCDKVWVALAYGDFAQADRLAAYWLDDESSGCTRGPQDVYAELAVWAHQEDLPERAAIYARAQEKCLRDGRTMHNRRATLPLFEYYVLVEEWESAQSWFERLAPDVLNTVLGGHRLRYLRAACTYLQNRPGAEASTIPFPAEVLPLSADPNGQFACTELLAWFQAEEAALTEVMRQRVA